PAKASPSRGRHLDRPYQSRTYEESSPHPPPFHDRAAKYIRTFSRRYLLLGALCPVTRHSGWALTQDDAQVRWWRPLTGESCEWHRVRTRHRRKAPAKSQRVRTQTARCTDRL